MAQSTITGDQQERGHNGKPAVRARRTGRIDDLVLDRRLGDRTWLGHVAESDQVAAVRLCATGDPPTDDVANVMDRAGALGTLRSAYLIPVLGAAWVEGAVWVVSQWDAGTSLRRLQQLTWLTPAQAVVIGSEVLCALRDLIFAGYTAGAVYPSDIRVDPAGHVRLTGWAAPNLLADADSSRGSVRSASVLLADLATTARRSDPRATDLIALLDASAEKLAAPGVGIEHIPGVATELAGAVEGVRLLQARAELSALTAAARGPAPRAAVPPTRRRPPGVPSAPTRVRVNVRRTRRAALRWAIAILVLALAVGAEQLFLHGRIIHDLRTLIGHSPTTHSTTATHHHKQTAPARVAAGAPAHAGVIKSVTLRAMRPCHPGSACSMRVLVQLRPHPHPLRIGWRFAVINRCAGTRHHETGGTLAAPAHARHIYGVSTVHVPNRRAVAVVAVTRHPARAASRPLLVPAGGGRC